MQDYVRHRTQLAVALDLLIHGMLIGAFILAIVAPLTPFYRKELDVSRPPLYLTKKLLWGLLVILLLSFYVLYRMCKSTFKYADPKEAKCSAKFWIASHTLLLLCICIYLVYYKYYAGLIIVGLLRLSFLLVGKEYISDLTQSIKSDGNQEP